MLPLQFVIIFICASVVSSTSLMIKDKYPVLQFQKRRGPPQSPSARKKFLKREYLFNGFVSYIITLDVGTPPQEMQSYIDTGSADIWFQTPLSLQCTTSSTMYSNLTSCDDLGVTYLLADQSSTFELQDREFVMSYESGYEVTSGSFASDRIALGDFAVPRQLFGVAYESNFQDLGYMGLGLEGIEYNRGAKYPTFVENLYTEGLIEKKMFSIYLNDQFADGGEILFGAIDDSKYSGSLVAHDLTSENEFFIQSNGTYFDGIQIISDRPALLDTGTTSMSIPTESFRQIINKLNASFNYDYGLYSVICKDYNTTAPDLIFKFGEQYITVPPSEYLMNYNIGSNGEVEPVQDENGEDLCFLGFDADDDALILGDTFIRSVYAVFDLDARQISLAEAAWNVGGEFSSSMLSLTASSSVLSSWTFTPSSTLSSSSIELSSSSVVSSTLSSILSSASVESSSLSSIQSSSLAEPTSFSTQLSSISEVSTFSSSPETSSISDTDPSSSILSSSFSISLSVPISSTSFSIDSESTTIETETPLSSTFSTSGPIISPSTISSISITSSLDHSHSLLAAETSTDPVSSLIDQVTISTRTSSNNGHINSSHGLFSILCLFSTFLI